MPLEASTTQATPTPPVEFAALSAAGEELVYLLDTAGNLWCVFRHPDATVEWRFIGTPQ